LEVQYADYAVWQRERLSGEVLEEQIRYRRGQLEGAPVVTQMPTDRVRPAVQSYRGASEWVELKGEMKEGLREMRVREGATMFMVMLGAFKVLMYRYSGQEDVVVGTPIANRTRKEVEGLIGFFVNTLVMRSRIEGEMSFREVLVREKEVAIGAYGHQEVPFEKLVEELQPERDLSYTPMFQVMFILQNAPVTAFHLPGLTLTPLNPYMSATHFDLTLNVIEEEGQLICLMEYNTDLFDATTITRILQHYRTILAAVVENPDVRVIDIPLDVNDQQAGFDMKLELEARYEDDQFVF